VSFGEAETSQESTEAPEPVEAPEPQEDHSEQGSSDSNPFWKEVEEAIGPNNYKLIQPHLTKADTEARNRISELNQSYAPWKAFADQGITPDQVTQSVGVVQRLNDPQGQVEVYESLRTFLEREGRLPNQAELSQEVEDNEESPEEEADPRDAQLRELQEQQSKIQQFLQGQYETAQRQQMEAQADQELKSEIDTLRNTHQDLDDADMKEVVRIAAFAAQQGEEITLDQAYGKFAELRDRIRTAPRPSASAPRLPGGSGGSPSSAPVDPSTMTKQQRQDLVSQMLQRK
jgi:hypothetical protein|tara:strand:- start:13425 stop:14288 length:864 start_codon:yes stop_codon:yes gene_type:complete